MSKFTTERRTRAKELFQLAGLYCLTDSQLAGGRDNIAIARQMLDGGAKIIQYREKHKTQLAMFQDCLAIRDMTKAAGAAFFVNDDIALAIAVAADGVHVGQDDLPLPVVRQIVGETMLVGLSTHSPEQAHNAVIVGADYIGVGPVYPTQTKQNLCDPVGLQYVEYVARNIKLAFVAIGGINAANVRSVVAHGADCVAMISEIVAATDIQQTIQSVTLDIQMARGIRV